MTDPKNAPPAAPPQRAGASDLPDDLASRIDALHERLSTTDHYTLLDLPRKATRAQIRAAFLRIGPQFHPDRYFGKRLGTYAPKMQRIFAQLSLAHDTLVNDERRAAYDRSLPPPLPPALAPPVAAPAPAPPPPPPSPPSDPPVASHSSAPPRSVSDQERARAFASRLAGSGSARFRTATPVTAFTPGSRPTPGKPFPAPTPGRPFPAAAPLRPSSSTMPAVDPKAAVEALRRRYEDTIAQARGKQTSQHVQAAEAAAARGDFTEAARLYRLAFEHTSDPAMRAVLYQTEAKAKEQQHAAAVARAREAEQKHDFTEAAMNWARAFDHVPDAETAHHAALCFRRAAIDPRRAAKYGEEAVKLDPNKASYRVNLGYAYIDAGLVLRARGEIERAQALEPQNPLVKEALARLKTMR